MIKKEEVAKVEKIDQEDEIEIYQKKRIEFDMAALSKSENFSLKEKVKYVNLVKNFSPDNLKLNDFVKTRLKMYKNGMGEFDEREKKRYQRIGEIEMNLLELRKQKEKEDYEKLFNDEKSRKIKEITHKDLIDKQNNYYQGSKQKVEKFLIKSDEFKIKNQQFYSQKFDDDKKKKKKDWKEIKIIEHKKLVI